MTARLLTPLALAAAVLFGCGGAAPGDRPRAAMRITEQRDGLRCATPCARLHDADRLTGECRPRVRYSSGQGIMGGQISAEFEITERSRRGCEISGYPVIRMIDGRGRQLPTHVQQRTDYPATLLRLSRDHPIYFNEQLRVFTPCNGELWIGPL